MPEVQNSKDRLKEITASIEDGIKNLFQTDKYQQYLRTMSRFHKYSVNNTMLIYMQKPDATLVAGFNKWRDQFERNVMKGERGIKIIAPTPYKKKIEQEKLDPDTKLPMLDADGNVIIEEKTVQIPMYKVVSVFDLAQTDGKPLPMLATDLTGNVKNFDVFMEALKRSAPVPIAFEAMQHDMDGYFSGEDQRIAIREGMSEVQTVSATVHEIAHSKLHNKDMPEVREQWKLVMLSDGGTKKDFTGGFETRAEAEAAGEKSDWQYTDENAFVWRLEVEEDTSIAEFVKKSRSTEEVEAESVSFAVCAYYGIATGENSFGYIAGWSKDKELSELRASLESINKTASGLITDVDRNYAIVMKERGLDKAEPEQAAQEPSTLEPVADKPIEQYFEYKLHANPRSTGEMDAAFIQAYEHRGGELYPADIIGFGAYDDLRSLVNRFNDEKAAPEDAKKVFDASFDKQPGYEEWSEPATAENAPVQSDTPSDDVSAYLSDEAPLGGGRIVDIQVETNGPNAKPAFPADYPMPDPTVSVEAMNSYGYTDGDMLPLTKERAMELFEQDITVYMLYEGNGSGMAFDTEDIEMHSGIFGVSVEEWEEVKDSVSAMQIDLAEQQKQLEASFLGSEKDSFAIYQLKRDDEYTDIRFMNSDYLKEHDIVPERGSYELVYTGTFPREGDPINRLDELYYRFNEDRPADFPGHSLSVSDIVALKQDGVVSCHYVDSFGFKELPTFLKPENYLKNAEMAMEDDYGMIDGVINNGVKQPTVAELEQQAKSGQPISLMDLMEATRREQQQERKTQPKTRQEKRPSVLAQLRAPLDPTKSKKAPVKSAEREM